MIWMSKYSRKLNYIPVHAFCACVPVDLAS